LIAARCTSEDFLSFDRCERGEACARKPFIKVISALDKLNSTVKPTDFGVVISSDAGEFSCCSGGGDGIFKTCGLSSFTPSSRVCFGVSAGVVVIEGRY